MWPKHIKDIRPTLASLGSKVSLEPFSQTGTICFAALLPCLVSTF